MVGVCREKSGDRSGKWEELVVEFDVVGKWSGSETCGVEMGNDIAKQSVVRECVGPIMIVTVVVGSSSSSKCVIFDLN